MTKDKTESEELPNEIWVAVHRSGTLLAREGQHPEREFDTPRTREPQARYIRADRAPTPVLADDVREDKMSSLPLDFTLHPDFGDPECLFNMRKWLQSAIEAKGAKQTGTGMGMGEADIDFTLEGHRYNVTIRARLK